MVVEVVATPGSALVGAVADVSAVSAQPAAATATRTRRRSFIRAVCHAPLATLRAMSPLDESVAAPYDLLTAEHDLSDGESEIVRSYVICSTPRSGSTLLAEAMHRTGELGVPAEYIDVAANLPKEHTYETSSRGGAVVDRTTRLGGTTT